MKIRIIILLVSFMFSEFDSIGSSGLTDSYYENSEDQQNRHADDMQDIKTDDK